MVDNKDNQIGDMEKLSAHLEGKLHRAFSICVFNSKGELLIQKRAKNKYHSGGLWTNTCCGHPRPGEKLIGAARRRLKEELGFDTELKECFSFIYEAKFENGLREHEYDHVMRGDYAGKIIPNPDEIEDWKWIALDKLKSEVRRNPGKYSFWFVKILNKIDQLIK